MDRSGAEMVYRYIGRENCKAFLELLAAVVLILPGRVGRGKDHIMALQEIWPD